MVGGADGSLVGRGGGLGEGGRAGGLAIVFEDFLHGVARFSGTCVDGGAEGGVVKSVTNRCKLRCLRVVRAFSVVVSLLLIRLAPLSRVFYVPTPILIIYLVETIHSLII